MIQKKDDNLNELSQRILARPRECDEFDIAPLIGFGGKEVVKVAIRVPTSREQQNAWDDAHVRIQKRAEKVPAVAHDPDIMLDARASSIVAVACRNPAKPDKDPAWPSASWIDEHMSADEIGALLRLVNIVRARKGPTPEEIDDERVEMFAAMAARTSGTDVADVAMASVTHTYLSQLYILTCVKLAEARAALKAAEKTES